MLGGINAVKGERKKRNFRFKIEGKLNKGSDSNIHDFRVKKYANIVLGQGPTFECTKKYKPNIALKSCGTHPVAFWEFQHRISQS